MQNRNKNFGQNEGNSLDTRVTVLEFFFLRKLQCNRSSFQSGDVDHRGVQHEDVALQLFGRAEAVPRADVHLLLLQVRLPHVIGNVHR